MSIFDPHLSFDKAKPFYPLVINYVTQVHGYIDICSRGISSKLAQLGPEEVQQFLNEQGFKEEGLDTAVQTVRVGGNTGFVGDPNLESKVLGRGVKVGIDSLAQEVIDNHAASINHFNRMSAGSLLILAYELTKTCHSHAPLWEFLRHCRNAAAHKGHFNFMNREPKRPAKWRTLEVVSALQGKPLFFDAPFPGFMGIGDTLVLLWDIEQAFPGIK